MCPEDAPVKSKMLHASSKALVVQSLPALGIEVAKSIEGLEPNEITIPELGSQLYAMNGSSAPLVPITKPAARGGRRLVRRGA